MKKRFLGLTLALAMIFSLNAVVLADPGNGGGDEPGISYPIGAISLPIELPPTDYPLPACPEDCQGEDNDQQ